MCHISKTIYSNKFKLFLYIVVCLVPIYFGIRSLSSGNITEPIVLFFFGGLGIVMFLLMLVPSLFYLKIDTNGFEARLIFRKIKLDWDEIKTIRVSTVRGPRTKIWIRAKSKFIGFDYSGVRSRQKYKLLGKVFTGSNDGIPNIFSCSAEKIVELMNSAKENHDAHKELSRSETILD